MLAALGCISNLSDLPFASWITVLQSVKQFWRWGKVCSNYSLLSGRRGSLPVCSNPPSPSPQMQTFSGLSSPGSTLQSSGGPSAVLTQLLQTLISHCLGLQGPFCPSANTLRWVGSHGPAGPTLAFPRMPYTSPALTPFPWFPSSQSPNSAPNTTSSGSVLSSAAVCLGHPCIPGLPSFHASPPTAPSGELCAVKWTPSWPISLQKVGYVLDVGPGAMGSPWSRAGKGTSAW